MINWEEASVDQLIHEIRTKWKRILRLSDKRPHVTSQAICTYFDIPANDQDQQLRLMTKIKNLPIITNHDDDTISIINAEEFSDEKFNRREDPELLPITSPIRILAFKIPDPVIDNSPVHSDIFLLGKESRCCYECKEFDRYQNLCGLILIAHHPAHPACHDFTKEHNITFQTI